MDRLRSRSESVRTLGVWIRKVRSLSVWAGNIILVFFLRTIWEGFCWMRGRRPRSSWNKIRKILFIALDNPGDVLLMTPCLTGLKERFPQATLTVLAGEWSRELLLTHPAVSEVIPYNAPWFDRYVSHLPHQPFRPARDFLQCAARLWREGFDLCVETRGEASHIVLATLGGIPQRVGYALVSQVPWLRVKAVAPLLTDTVPYAWDEWHNWHKVNYNLQVVASLGARPKDPSLVLPIPRHAQQSIDEFLERNGVQRDDLLIGVHPGASAERKRWSRTHFAKVVDSLIERWGGRAVVIGGAQEQELVRELTILMNHQPISAVGQTTLLEAAALVKRCHLVICNDSLITHLASAVKTPVVVVTRHPSNFYAPYQTLGVAITHRLPCVNQGLPDGCQCPFPEFLCLKQVTPEEVLEACEGILGSLGFRPKQSSSLARVPL